MKNNYQSNMFIDFPGYNRLIFPEKIKRVTAGAGGEALLILGSEKTGLIDCGMAYCAEDLIENIKEILLAENRQLDFVFLTHTHYDHIGALPYVLKCWPEIIVYGAAYCGKVFNSVGAKNKMAELGRIAWLKYKKQEPDEVMVDGLRIDVSVREDEPVWLGEEFLVALETKGHTDCSTTYILEPDGIMFASESTGVLESPDSMHISILKSYSDAMNSVKKCAGYPIKHLISPHYGMIPDFFVKEYWEMFISFAEEKRMFIFQLFSQDLTLEEILDEYSKKYWSDARGTEQPKEAFKENGANIIKAILKEF